MMSVYYFYKPGFLNQPFGPRTLCYGTGSYGLSLYTSPAEALAAARQEKRPSVWPTPRSQDISRVHLRAQSEAVSLLNMVVDPQIWEGIEDLNKTIRIPPFTPRQRRVPSSWYVVLEWLKQHRSGPMIGQILAQSGLSLIDVRAAGAQEEKRVLTNPAWIETVEDDRYDLQADAFQPDLRVRRKVPLPRSWSAFQKHYTIEGENLTGGASLYVYQAQSLCRRTYIKEAVNPEATLEQYILHDVSQTVLELFGVPEAHVPRAQLLVKPKERPVLALAAWKGDETQLDDLEQSPRSGRALEALGMLAELLGHDDFGEDQCLQRRENVALLDLGGAGRFDWGGDEKKYSKRLASRAFFERFHIASFDGGHLTLEDKIGMMTRLQDGLPRVWEVILQASQRIDALGLRVPLFNDDVLRKDFYAPFAARTRAALRLLKDQNNIFKEKHGQGRLARGRVPVVEP